MASIKGIKFELAVTDDFKKVYSNWSNLISKSSKDLDNYFVAIRQLEKLINEIKSTSSSVVSIAQELRKAEDEVTTQLEKTNQKIKATNSELGTSIKITDLLDLSGLQKSNTLSTSIQSDANSYVKYANSLQKPTI